MREHARERRVPVRCASRRVRRMMKTERRVASFHFPRDLPREAGVESHDVPFPGARPSVTRGARPRSRDGVGARAVPARSAKGELREVRRVRTRQAAEQLRLVHRLPAWQGEAQVRPVQSLPARQGEGPLPGVQPVPPRQDEVALPEMPGLSARQVATALRDVPPVSPRQAEVRLQGVLRVRARKTAAPVRRVQAGGCRGGAGGVTDAEEAEDARVKAHDEKKRTRDATHERRMFERRGDARRDVYDVRVLSLIPRYGPSRHSTRDVLIEVRVLISIRARAFPRALAQHPLPLRLPLALLEPRERGRGRDDAVRHAARGSEQ